MYDESVTSTYERAYTTATVTAYEGQWVYFVATYDGRGGTSADAGIILYVNGSAVAMTLDGAGTYGEIQPGAHDVWIGRNTSTYADGKIDDVRIYSQELSASEVLKNYNAGKSKHS